MALNLRDCSFFGPALPEPFVKFQLEGELAKRRLLTRPTAEEAKRQDQQWDSYRRKLRALGEQGGDRRVAAHVLEPLAERFGYGSFDRQDDVITREGAEDGGWVFSAADGRTLRAWSVALGTDLDAPTRRGRAYRFSPSRVAQRVLLAKGERAGLLTDGEELRLLLCDPARPDSHIAVRLDRSGGWRSAREIPDSYRLFRALASPDGVAALPDLTDAARLAQSTVTRKLRTQARRAIEGFVQDVLDHPANTSQLVEFNDRNDLARVLWREGLVLVYRLLFVFKLETAPDPARAFSFAATSLWRNTYSPNAALASHVRRRLDDGADTGRLLEDGLRVLWRMFEQGLSSSELEVKALGGMLFGAGTTPLLDRLQWGESAVAHLLDALLWTPAEGKGGRERVHYGALDVEDLGRVYEALLELEPGLTTEPMCRLRRAKLEVVVPLEQGMPYVGSVMTATPDELDSDDDERQAEGLDDDRAIDDEDGERRPAAKSGRPSATAGKTQVQFIEEIPPGRFFLRVGLGRKATGSYYTPHPFVRFLVQETLGPQLAERSPKEDPQPGRILDLKVLDPAMGSGHFLVEACRYLGDALYEACRLCDELAVQAEEQAGSASDNGREVLVARATELRGRVEALPDPDNELLAYLPSRVIEGEESGFSQKKAEALCRRLVAVHCLYGVDKNPLAVELAKLSLWLESYAEGLPLTFMDHRLVCGDSLTGPFFHHLLTYPKSGKKLDDLYAENLTSRLTATLTAALRHVRDLEVSVGTDVADLELKRQAKQKLDADLAPLKTLAAAWSGGVMLGEHCDDGGYQALAEAVAAGEDTDAVLDANGGLRRMVALGINAVPFDLVFPEVFDPTDNASQGFDAVVGNPPWEKVRVERRDMVAMLGTALLRGRESAGAGSEHALIEGLFEGDPELRAYANGIGGLRALAERVMLSALALAGQPRPAILDLYHLFLLRLHDWASPSARAGLVLGSGIIKGPSESGLRTLVFSWFFPQVVAHYFNLRQLFEGASSRVAFVVTVLSRAPSTYQFAGSELSEFGHIQRESGACRLIAKVHGGGTVDTAEAYRPDSSGALKSLGIDVSEGLHRTGNKRHLVPLQKLVDGSSDARDPLVSAALLARGFVCLYGGRSIDFFDALPTRRSGKWTPQVDLAIDLRAPRLQASVASLQHFRLAWRNTCGFVATNDRSARACLLPPGTAAAGSIVVEWQPQQRPDATALWCICVVNSFTFDMDVRSLVQTNFNKAVLRQTRWPNAPSELLPLLAHSALRLSCNHAGYAPLWEEQLGDAWREPKLRHTWPVLEGDDERWAVRAVIDAVVAEAYGLDRAQYEHVLSTFSHKSYPKAPDVCLAAFDELKLLGLDAFTKKHDPYWDIPLNESLPKPVIDLPIPAGAASDAGGRGPLFAGLDPDEPGGPRPEPPKGKGRSRKASHE